MSQGSQLQIYTVWIRVEQDSDPDVGTLFEIKGLARSVYCILSHFTERYPDLTPVSYCVTKTEEIGGTVIFHCHATEDDGDDDFLDRQYSWTQWNT